MKEEITETVKLSLEQELANAIHKAVGAAENSGEFLVAELPEFLEEVLLWYGAYNFIFFVFGVLLLIAILSIDVYLTKKHYQIYKEEAEAEKNNCYKKACEEFLFNQFMACCVRLIYIGPFSLMNLTWLKVWIAPKLFLIEYAANLVK